jgi:hypothetical protein
MAGLDNASRRSSDGAASKAASASTLSKAYRIAHKQKLAY